MANARLIANASPLIFLSRSGHLDLLRAFADEVWVPEPVVAEICLRGPQDITARAITETDWIMARPVPRTPGVIAEWRLGPGKSGVLALALQRAGTEALIDDLLARKCAASLEIPFRGTLGVVLVAKQRGLVPLARPIIEDLLAAGLYLSRKLLDEALRRVGE